MFSFENENVRLMCRTQNLRWNKKSEMRRVTQSFFLKSTSSPSAASVINNGRKTMGYQPPIVSTRHIWLDNTNKQIKENNEMYELMSNGDLLIKNLKHQLHFGQFACVTRQGNRIDSVSTFIYPMKQQK